MTGTGVLQVLSLKQNFPRLRLETLSEFYLLEFSDGLASGANSICPGVSTLTLHHIVNNRIYVVVSDESSTDARRPTLWPSQEFAPTCNFHPSQSWRGQPP